MGKENLKGEERKRERIWRGMKHIHWTNEYRREHFTFTQCSRGSNWDQNNLEFKDPKQSHLHLGWVRLGCLSIVCFRFNSLLFGQCPNLLSCVSQSSLRDRHIHIRRRHRTHTQTDTETGSMNEGVKKKSDFRSQRNIKRKEKEKGNKRRERQFGQINVIILAGGSPSHLSRKIRNNVRNDRKMTKAHCIVQTELN